MKNSLAHTVQEQQRNSLNSEIAKLTTRIKALESGVNPEPRTHYDSPGVDMNCQRYQDFIAQLIKKPDKSLTDLEYLGVNELKASYDLAAGHQFILPPGMEFPPNNEDFDPTLRTQNDCKRWLLKIYEEYFRTRNFERCLDLIERFKRRPPRLIVGYGDYEHTRTVESFKIKIFYKKQDYRRVIKIINALDFWVSEGFRAPFYYTQRGLAKYKLKDYAGALTDYQRALGLKEVPGGPAVLYWNQAQIYRRQKDYAAAAAQVRRMLECPQKPPDVSYQHTKEYYMHLQGKT